MTFTASGRNCELEIVPLLQEINSPKLHGAYTHPLPFTLPAIENIGKDCPSSASNKQKTNRTRVFVPEQVARIRERYPFIEATMMNNTLSRSRTELARSEKGQHLPMNLQDMLHELGNKLVLEHGFRPANLYGCSNHINRTTEPLERFLVWLQHTPEAGSVLRDMGVWQEDIRETTAALPKKTTVA
jgi:hypothetical protein